MAAFARALAEAVLSSSTKPENLIIPHIIQHFNSKRTDEMAVVTFEKNYYSPGPTDIEDAIRFLTMMIKYLREK